MVEMRKALRRSRTNRMIAGVVGGLAEYWSIDATLARVGFVVLSVISAAFPGILVYVLLWVAPHASGMARSARITHL
jgi:phage shock protein C